MVVSKLYNRVMERVELLMEGDSPKMVLFDYGTEDITR